MNQDFAEDHQTPGSRWLAFIGKLLLTLGVLAAVTSIGMMFLAYQQVATSTRAPEPVDLAKGIAKGSRIGQAAIPLVVIGIVILLFARTRRRRAD